MKFFRHALFAILLLLAQSGALTHAVEHLQSDTDAPVSHSCSLCIAAHGLDSALASTTPDLAPTAANFAPPGEFIAATCVTPALAPRARAPPVCLIET